MNTGAAGRHRDAPRFVIGCLSDFGFHLANIEHGILCLWEVRSELGWTGLMLYLVVHGLEVVQGHA